MKKPIKLVLVTMSPLIVTSLIVSLFKDSLSLGGAVVILKGTLIYVSVIIFFVGAGLFLAGMQSVIKKKYPPNSWVKDYIGGGHRTESPILHAFLLGSLCMLSGSAFMYISPQVLLTSIKLEESHFPKWEKKESIKSMGST